MLFATSLVFERMPLHLGNLLDGLSVWAQNAGGVAAFAIVLVLIARVARRDPNELNFWSFGPRLQSLLPILKGCIIASGVGYLVLIAVWSADRLGIPGLTRMLPRPVGAPFYTIGDGILTLCGLLALSVVFTPIAVDLATRISPGRIWAIARLSWKEAVRGRVIWVFGSMALVFLFADWFVPAKAEDQLRSYVRVVYWSMTPLFLLTAALLGSFSIPNDVKNNSIHTIVTKPVEKIEVVLGRFFGYAALLTIGLLVVSGLSLIYVLRGVNEEAAQESFTARVPQYGQISFVGTKNPNEGDNVGREFTHRSYITGPTKVKREGTRQYAVWDFPQIPADVRQREKDVFFEFAFDIFRLSKGDEEGKGVYCTFTFVNVNAFATPERDRQAQELENRTDLLKKKRENERAKVNKQFDSDIAAKTRAFEKAQKGQDASRVKELTDQHQKALEEIQTLRDGALHQIELGLIKHFGIYQAASIEVTDYHTQAVPIPPKEFQELLADNAGEQGNAIAERPALRVFVSVDVAKQAQMVGVAPQDFYLLAYERPFWQNFLKGVLGMWFTHMLVLGIAIACSTYLSSVISLLLTLKLYIAGLNIDYLREIAERRVEGGGPIEASLRLGTKMGPAAQLEASPTTSLIRGADTVFSWWVGRILNLIPDISRHDLHQYVANGFDIAWLDVLLIDNALPLFGYLIPWAVAAYYLMKYREIANPQ